MFTTQAAPLGAVPDAASAASEDFRVRSSADVHALLRQFVEGDVALALTTPDGVYYSTTLWADDPERGMLVFSADPGDLKVHRLIESDEVVAVGYLEAVKVQFDVQGLVLVHGRDASALNAEYPLELFRFQRRGNFRVRPLTHAQPVARLVHPGLPGIVLTLRVMDVSQGGAAIFLPDDVPALGHGQVLGDVHLELDAHTRLKLALRIIHVTELTEAGRGLRLGCEMIGLTGEASRALQRYIDQTQKRRRLISL